MMTIMIYSSNSNSSSAIREARQKDAGLKKKDMAF